MEGSHICPIYLPTALSPLVPLQYDDKQFALLCMCPLYSEFEKERKRQPCSPRVFRLTYACICGIRDLERLGKFTYTGREEYVKCGGKERLWDPERNGNKICMQQHTPEHDIIEAHYKISRYQSMLDATKAPQKNSYSSASVQKS